MTEQKIITGDCLEVMRTMDANSIDCIVTDPPYGLHFMGKDWDHGIPGQHFWIEALRICKPGAMLLAFGGTRTYHRVTCSIEDAGWEIRDCLMWLYGSGFPKSHNHFGFPGYGTALKPAYEPIIMAMKPLEGTYAQNAEKWGVAGINIDECRIQASDQDKLAKNWDRETVTDMRSGNYGNGIASGIKLETKAPVGRWPANLLLDEDAGKMLDEQTSHLKSGHRNRENHKLHKAENIYKLGMNLHANFKDYNDSGGASRFFYCAKSSSAERNAGLENFPLKAAFDNESGPMGGNMGSKSGFRQNNHPTVKPLALMQYLIKLVMPLNKNAVLLDPFAGSGTTILAAKQLNCNATGIEISEEYAEIARKRLESCKLPIEQFELDL